GGDHATAGIHELRDQLRFDALKRGRDHDRIIGGVFGPATPTVAHANQNILETQPIKTLAGLLRKKPDIFHGEYLRPGRSHDGAAVAAAAPHFQDLHALANPDQRKHARHYRRLRDILPKPNLELVILGGSRLKGAID